MKSFQLAYYVMQEKTALLLSIYSKIEQCHSIMTFGEMRNAENCGENKKIVKFIY